MADPTPQATFPPILGEVSDGDAVVFRRVGGALYLASGSAGTGPTGPSGSSRSGVTGPTGPSGRVITFNPADKSASITLSNNNLTGTSSNVSWVSARAIGPYKSAGKAYFRCTVVNASYTGAAFATSAASLATFFGSGVGEGVLAYGQPGSFVTVEYHGAGGIHASAPAAAGDWIVAAIDLATGNFWMTVQTAAGVLNTSWNAETPGNSPAAGTGPIATDLAGVLVVPGCSFFNSAVSTIDGNTVISDPTLSGFVPWSLL